MRKGMRQERGEARQFGVAQCLSWDLVAFATAAGGIRNKETGRRYIIKTR